MTDFIIENGILKKYTGPGGAVVIPQGVTSIGEHAFSTCRLTSVVIPDGLTSIGKYAFQNCDRLISVTVPEGMISIKTGAFYGCSSLTDIRIPDSVTSIGNGAFYECSNLNSIRIPNGVTSIGTGTFYGCSNLKEIKIPERVTSIGMYAFHGCSDALSIHMTDLETYMRLDFQCKHSLYINGKFITNAQIPDGVATIGYHAFSLLVDEKKTEDEEQILYEEVELKKGVCFPMGKDGTWWRVLEIDLNANEALVIAHESLCKKAYHERREAVTWENCTLRQWLNGEYYDNTFSEEEKEAILETELENPDNARYHTRGGNRTKDKIFLLSIDEAEQYFESDADMASGRWWWLRSPGCSQRYAATVYNDGSVYYYDGNFVDDDKYCVRPALKINLKSELFQSFLSNNLNSEAVIKIPHGYIRDSRLLSMNPAHKAITACIIPDVVTEIGENAFQNCKKLKEVKLPESLKKIGKEAFLNCSELETIECSSECVNWGKDALYGCSRLKYTPQLFHTSGKLCNEFLEHFDAADAEGIAGAWLYQKGAAWEETLKKAVTAENAGEFLTVMTEILRRSKATKKPAGAAAEYVRRFVQLLKKEEIKEFCAILREKKCGELAEELLRDPVIAAKLQEDGETAVDEKQTGKETILPDGSILYGTVSVPLQKGSIIQLREKSSEYWRILDINEEDKSMLVIAEEPICVKEYHEKWEAFTWENCTLRQWLNGEYYDKTFSEEEKEGILETELENPDNAEYNTRGGNNTRDKVFLLSIDEAEQYFVSNEDRECGSWWWLRSPGRTQLYAAFVSYDGSVFFDGNHVFIGNVCVRPAFKINPESELFKSLIRINENQPFLKIKGGVLTECNRNAERVSIPAYVKEIAKGAFTRCARLKTVTWENPKIKIGREAFSGCPQLILPADYYCTEKTVDETYAKYLPADAEAMAYVLFYQKNKNAWYRTWHRTVAEKLTAENAPVMAEKLLIFAEKAKILKDEQKDALLRFALACSGVLSKNTLQKFNDILKNTGEKNRWLERELEDEDRDTGEIAKEIFCIREDILRENLVLFPALPRLSQLVSAADSYQKACRWDTAYVAPSEYKRGAFDTYTKDAEAEQAAAELDHEVLMQILKSWAEKINDSWYAPYAAYADEERLNALIKDMDTWAKQGKAGKKRIIRVRGAILLNDTKIAMAYAEKLGLLDRYAALRGMTADDIRDTTLSDFGLDESGRKTWTLAGQTYTAKINNDLTATLTDADGKVLKTLPKKGAAPEEAEAAAKEYNSLKKSLKPAAKLRNDQLFADFLSGRTRTAKAWKGTYLVNPLLGILARLIVWTQGGRTFTLHDDGQAYDVEGRLYDITEEDIAVAHPMEMAPEETKAWQGYFLANGLKQPFAQVWEPVLDGNTITPDRYKGATIPLYMLMNKDMHGITMQGQSSLQLRDCRANLRLVEGHKDWINNEFEITDFKFEKYTRAVNHIACHFDKGTVQGRLLKDDVSAVSWLENFTQALVTELTDLVLAKGDCPNAAAALLTYRHEHYPETEGDAFADFVLEW